MVSVKSIIRAGAATLISTAACAADLPPPAPQYQPPIAYQAPPAVMETGGWYLRGDVGIGVQNFSDFPHSQLNSAFVWPASWQIVQKDIQDTSIVGIGAGYEINNWFRVDVTGEYRTKAMWKATGSYTDFCAGGLTCFDVTSGNLSSTVVMANAYLDLGTWWCLTPYVGAGIGGAYNRITDVQDNGINSSGTVGFGYTYSDSAKWDLAWNVQAGVTYNVTNNFKVDFNYRYLRLGSPATAVVQCQDTTPCPGAFYNLSDMTSQDFRIGVRWMLQPEPTPVMMPAPLMSRG
jgi:opacity protein-like surface antigen